MILPQACGSSATLSAPHTISPKTIDFPPPVLAGKVNMSSQPLPSAGRGLADLQDYYRMLSGSAHPDRALALARAQRHMIAGEGAAAAGGLDSGFPGFWAGFVLSGNGSAGS